MSWDKELNTWELTSIQGLNYGLYGFWLVSLLGSLISSRLIVMITLCFVRRFFFFQEKIK